MADNYVEFSQVLPHLNDAEIAWLQDQLQEVVVVEDQEHPIGSVPAEVEENHATWRGARFLHNCDDVTGWGDEIEFAYAFRFEDGNVDWGRHLWIYSEQYGSVDQVAWLVQKFLRQFRPQDIWALTYACTCSKPRIAEFGGGAVIVTADELRWEDVQSIAEKACRDWKETTPPVSKT